MLALIRNTEKNLLPCHLRIMMPPQESQRRVVGIHQVKYKSYHLNTSLLLTLLQLNFLLELSSMFNNVHCKFKDYPRLKLQPLPINLLTCSLCGILTAILVYPGHFISFVHPLAPKSSTLLTCKG